MTENLLRVFVLEQKIIKDRENQKNDRGRFIRGGVKMLTISY